MDVEQALLETQDEVEKLEKTCSATQGKNKELKDKTEKLENYS